jgi:hypothetical protein
MQLIDFGHWLVYNSFAVVLAQFDSQVLFFDWVEEGTYLWLVASQFVAADAFVFVWVVKSLDGGVAFSTLQSFGTLVPADSFRKHFTVFGRILEYLWRPAEIPHVVGIDAALAIMAILFSRTPGSLVHKHVEYETVFFEVQALQVKV